MQLMEGLSVHFEWEGDEFRHPLTCFESIESKALAVLPATPTLEQIVRFEQLLLGLPQTEGEAIWHFAPGMAAREGRMPGKTFATGRRHRTEHLCVLAKGDITVWTEGGMKRLQAPAVIKSLPGAKRVAYMHTDVVWITFHATDETDPQKLIDELTYPEPSRIAGQTTSLLDGSAA